MRGRSCVDPRALRSPVGAPARSRRVAGTAALLVALLVSVHGRARDVAVELAGYSAGCGVDVMASVTGVDVGWPLGNGERGRVRLDLREGRPLIGRIAVSGDAEGAGVAVLESVDPVFFLTVGSRWTPPAKPDDQKWAVFFDKPAKRPHQTHLSALDLERVRVTSAGRRATVALETLRAGPFSGALELTFYAGARLVHVEAVVETPEDRRAIIYDAGLLGDPRDMLRAIAWIDTDGRLVRSEEGIDGSFRALAVRHRAIVAETEGGSIACFPPPHQFHFPRDWTDNFRYVWHGRGNRGRTDRFGIGIRQDGEGGGAFVPWFNAPPGVPHRLGQFLLVTRGDARHALDEVLRFTHGDRFPDLPGHLTLTSHWHMAVAVTAMKQSERRVDPLPVPDFVGMFKAMNVDMVHLAEFHGDGHQKDPGPLRLPELEAMFSECRRLSDDELLLIPGEEVNTFLGLRQPGKHPGHWMSLFPRPVFWIMQRGEGQPFAEPHERHGTVYRVGDRADMMRLLEREDGLVWSAHPRIKASSWTPDIFREEDFFLAEFWLGAAWKAMPADLSRVRLGERPLALLDDMANWVGAPVPERAARRKYMLGEVDVFKLDRTHELYGHMNINYVRLERLPRFDEGWRPLLDALGRGRFFVTTGEVIVRAFTLGGVESGGTLDFNRSARARLVVDLEWTFPLRFAEIASGDGERVHRERIDLADTGAFGSRRIERDLDLSGRTWVRFEAWDVAANGAFTQPIWILP